MAVSATAGVAGFFWKVDSFLLISAISLSVWASRGFFFINSRSLSFRSLASFMDNGLICSTSEA